MEKSEQYQKEKVELIEKVAGILMSTEKELAKFKEKWGDENIKNFGLFCGFLADRTPDDENNTRSLFCSTIVGDSSSLTDTLFYVASENGNSDGVFKLYVNAAMLNLQLEKEED